MRESGDRSALPYILTTTMNKKKTRTTYGVYNLVEWQALLRMGKATVKVPFTGGSITTQGVTPATFTTENPVVQFAIERSPEFKTGKIKVVRRSQLEGMVEIERNHAKASDAVSPTETTQANDEIPTKCAVNETDPIPAEPVVTDTKEAVTPIEFSCNDDAKDYLEQNFGFIRSKLHNREEIIKAGHAHGLDIKFV